MQALFSVGHTDSRSTENVCKRRLEEVPCLNVIFVVVVPHFFRKVGMKMFSSSLLRKHRPPNGLSWNLPPQLPQTREPRRTQWHRGCNYREWTRASTQISSKSWTKSLAKSFLGVSTVRVTRCRRVPCSPYPPIRKGRWRYQRTARKLTRVGRSSPRLLPHGVSTFLACRCQVRVAVLLLRGTELPNVRTWGCGKISDVKDDVSQLVSVIPLCS